MKIYWYSGCLVILGSTPKLEKLLTITKKSLEWNASRFRRETKRYQEQLFNVMLEGPPESRTIITLQGFKDKVINFCSMQKINFEFFDCRTPLPEPMLELSGDFRLEQQALFEGLLSRNESGLLQAPTRYGKTVMIANTIRVFPNQTTVVAAPGVDLLGQLVDDLKSWLPGREVKGIFTGSRNRVPSDDITVCSFDSLQKINTENVKLLLIDEPHAAVSESRAPLISKFENARIYGYGATLKGRYDGADDLITGLIGPIHSKRTFQEAVEEGAICPIKVSFIEVPFEPWPCTDRTQAYRQLLYQNDSLASLVKEISTRHIPEDWQSLIFIDQKKQADLIAEVVENTEIAVASRMTRAERKDLFERMSANEVKRCVCTSIYAQGVTFPDLRVMVNVAGGGGSISSVQKPGRLAQMRPNKTKGYLVDFLFKPVSESTNSSSAAWQQVIRDCNARMKTYRDMGYTVEILESVNELTFD
jgi:superfamily II DNA or RNA helicase